MPAGQCQHVKSLMLGRSSALVPPLMSQSHWATEGPCMPAGHVSRPRFDLSVQPQQQQIKHRKGTDGLPPCMHHLDLPLWGQPNTQAGACAALAHM